MVIIKIKADSNGWHQMQSQSHRKECWLEGFIAVPSELEETAFECDGYCDLVIQGGILKGITPRPERRPQAEEPITAEQRLAALEAAMLEMALGGAE